MSITYTQAELITKIEELQLIVAAQNKLITDKRLWPRSYAKNKTTRRERAKLLYKSLNNLIKLYDGTMFHNLSQAQTLSLMLHSIDLTKMLIEDIDEQYFIQNNVAKMVPLSSLEQKSSGGK